MFYTLTPDGRRWAYAHGVWSLITASPGDPVPCTEASWRWIPTSERLPDVDQPVACIEPGVTWGAEEPSYGVMLFAIYKDGKFQVDRPPEYEAKATHWMPLPSMPYRRSSSDSL